MPRVESFPPIADRDARVLVLGSMPGRASLAAGEYYAHPRNAFWRIASVLLTGSGVLATEPYSRRVAHLSANGIALWDVLASCVRESSLDSDIDDMTSVPNDFARFFRRHPGITHVFWNGAKAEQSYRKFVLPGLEHAGHACARLPSTSPAHAALSFERKLAAWRVVELEARTLR